MARFTHRGTLSRGLIRLSGIAHPIGGWPDTQSRTGAIWHLGGRDARLINASRSERSAIGGGQVLRANDPPAASPFRLTAGAGFLIECQRRPVLECSRRV